MSPLVIERVYNAPAEKVWQALTSADAMRHWYFDLPEFKAEPGFEFEFHGKGKDGQDFLHKCRVTAVEPGRKLTHSWRYEGYPGESYVTFELFPEGDKTRIKLTHEGLETFPQDTNDFARGNFEMGWNQIIGTSLKEYVE
jgi:uncharacterized protein YndB with AHSA1/START domain